MSDIILSYQLTRPDDKPVAAVFCLHGMQEHKERYEPFAECLKKHHIACVTYDLPGHGTGCPKEDLGWFGETDGWSNLVNSAVEIAGFTRKEIPEVPLVCFSHSMGTMIARTFIQKHDDLIDGLVLSGAPNYQPAAGVGVAVADMIGHIKGKRGHSKLLDQMAVGSFNKSVDHPRTPVDWLSYNEENVDKYQEDPYCGFPFTVQGYRDLFDGMRQMHDPDSFQTKNPDLPIYLFAGEDDPCIGGEKGFRDTEETLRKAGYHHIDDRLYPHMRHETMHEKNADEVMEDTVEWILKNTVS